MRKIRIEKDITIRWLGILTNGEAVSLEGRDLKLYIVSPYGASKEITGFTVSDNNIQFLFRASDQKNLGTYKLKLYENYGKSGQTVLDQCEGICLVSSTCQEGGSTEGLDTETVELSGGNLEAGVKGLSAYEIAVNNGFVGSEEEWLASLQGKDGKDFTYEDFTPEQIVELQRPATEAAGVANQASSKADAAAQVALEAASVTTQTDSLIKEAETLRVAAEQDRVKNELTRQSAETERESAENERAQAEQGRETAEQDRVSAESGRVSAEQSRAYAEQQRVTEFATLKQESETATTNANEAAENANQAAEGITDRLSETYPNLDAIKASGETNQDKIYIDAETNTSYRYNGSEFVSIGGGSDIVILPNTRLYEFSTNLEIEDSLPKTNHWTISFQGSLYEMNKILFNTIDDASKIGIKVYPAYAGHRIYYYYEGELKEVYINDVKNQITISYDGYSIRIFKNGNIYDSTELKGYNFNFSDKKLTFSNKYFLLFYRVFNFAIVDTTSLFNYGLSRLKKLDSSYKITDKNNHLFTIKGVSKEESTLVMTEGESRYFLNGWYSKSILYNNFISSCTIIAYHVFINTPVKIKIPSKSSLFSGFTYWKKIYQDGLEVTPNEDGYFYLSGNIEIYDIESRPTLQTIEISTVSGNAEINLYIEAYNAGCTLNIDSIGVSNNLIYDEFSGKIIEAERINISNDLKDIYIQEITPKGFWIGQQWINPTTQTAYVCVDIDKNLWKQITS